MCSERFWMTLTASSGTRRPTASRRHWGAVTTADVPGTVAPAHGRDEGGSPTRVLPRIRLVRESPGQQAGVVAERAGRPVVGQRRQLEEDLGALLGCADTPVTVEIGR